MRVAIAGAGIVGRSIAKELLEYGHEILLIDKDPSAMRSDSVPEADWLLADACELASLEEASLEDCHVAVAATGDDKTNLVFSLLAKTEFGVPRTVGRINHPANEWMFDDVWGVDVSVSTPRLICALVEEAVSVGDLIRLFTFQKGNANLVEMTLPGDSPCIGHRVRDFKLPADGVLVAIIRDGRAFAAEPDCALEAADELLFLIDGEHEDELAEMLISGDCGKGGSKPQTSS